MDYYDKYLKYKQKYLSLKDSFAQSAGIKKKYLALKEYDSFAQSTEINEMIGGKKRSKKNKREVSNQLQITVLKQGIKSENVLSCSYFTMAGAYRKVEKYQKNLNSLIHISVLLKEFEIRIYTDDSGKDFVLELAKDNPLISVYHYNFPPLREEIGHIGTFGTLIRLLPLFEEGLKMVWITDIDVSWKYLHRLRLDNVIYSGAKFSYRTFVCYDRTIYGRSYTILAGTILSLMTFPKKIFNNYLNNLVNPTKELKKNIDDLNTQNEVKFFNYKKSKVPYGIDEVFTNTNLYNYLVNKNIKCYILKDYIYAGVYLRLEKLLTPEDHQLIYIDDYHPTIDNFIKLKKVFKDKIPLMTNKYPCLVNDMMRNMDYFKESSQDSFVIPLIKTGKELDENLYE